MSYLTTFFGMQTAAQYTVALYNDSKEESQKFDAVFSNRIQYTKAVHADVKDWVAANIARWKAEGEDWFNIEMIPDKFLPIQIFLQEGGLLRRRSSVGQVGSATENGDTYRVHPEPQTRTTQKKNRDNSNRKKIV